MKGILSQQLTWHKPQIDCLIQMLIALITVRTVNLRELAVAMTNKKSLAASREKRLYRFFADFKFDINEIGIWVINLFFPCETKFYIAIDRTNGLTINWYLLKKTFKFLDLTQFGANL